MTPRDEIVRRLVGDLTEADRATFVRGITMGALVGAALAGSVLRARRARRRPRLVMQLDAAALDQVGAAGPDQPASAPDRGSTAELASEAVPRTEAAAQPAPSANGD